MHTMNSDGKSPETAIPKPTSEERLASVTVGGLVPVNKAIYLAPYDPEWPTRFYELAAQVYEALSDAVLLLEHVGSTSVPGLCAKPIIDMVLAVADSSAESSYVPALEARGFTLRIREPDWYEHRLLKGTDIDANLHVFSAGCVEIDRMLEFRDWLRVNEGDRRLYEEAKRTLAGRTWRYVQNYADAKSGIVQTILERSK